MKEKLTRFKTWYKTKLEAEPIETLAATTAFVGAVIGLYSKVSEASTNRSKAKTWKREVERREKLLEEK